MASPYIIVPHSAVKSPEPGSDEGKSPRSPESDFNATVAWTLAVKETTSGSLNHFKDYLRWAEQEGIIDLQQLGRLTDNMDNFFDAIPSPDSSMKDGSPNGHPERRLSAAAAAMKHQHNKSIGSTDSVTSGTDDSGTETESLEELTRMMEHPVVGVRVGRRSHVLRRYHNVFVGSEAVDWMINNGFAKTREDAVNLGRKLASRGMIAHVHGTKVFDDNKQYFYRFTKHPPSFSLQIPHTGPQAGVMGSLLSLVYHVHDNTVPQWLDTVTPEVLQLCFPAVIMWGCQNPDSREIISEKMGAIAKDHIALRLALVGFSKANGDILKSCLMKQVTTEEQASLDMVAEGAPPAATIKTFMEEKRQVVHPFTDAVVKEVILKKQFTSSAKPAWIQFKDDKGEFILPDAVAKTGDDLRKDMAVQLIFKACEAIWSAAPVTWRLGHYPEVLTYRVTVASQKAGYLEFVTGKTVKDVVEADGWKDVDLYKFAPSAVGSLVSGFILGVRDRHFENWMLVGDPKENPKLMQIDFGYMLMENPGGFPLDTPRLTMQPELVKLMKETPSRDSANNTLMQDLQADVVTAYRVLREHHPALVSFAKTVLSTIYRPEEVESFMWGKHAFRSGMADYKVMTWFEDKVKSQLSGFVMRRAAKWGLVQGYYAVRTVI